MKKGEQRGGEYIVTLHSDKKCFWCGRILKAKTKAERCYINPKSFYTCYPQDDKCIEAVKECMGDI